MGQYEKCCGINDKSQQLPVGCIAVSEFETEISDVEFDDHDYAAAAVGGGWYEPNDPHSLLCFSSRSNQLEPDYTLCCENIPVDIKLYDVDNSQLVAGLFSPSYYTCRQGVPSYKMCDGPCSHHIRGKLSQLNLCAFYFEAY